MSEDQNEPKAVHPGRPKPWRDRLSAGALFSNPVILIVVAAYFFLAPAASIVRDVADPNLRSAGIPEAAWRLHQNLTPKYERWARQRLDSARAAQLSTQDIAGTEWPLFGTVFYLWATESLQDAWEKASRPAGPPPKVYAREAVGAATRLVIDPKQASWVKKHWGDKYLKTQNLFYRMLVIAALTSHARLTGETLYRGQLQDQVDSLAAELDASPRGLLEDYPGECYPGDVLTAIAMIQRADKVLGADHSAFVRRALRAFQGGALDTLGLVPYSANAWRPERRSAARGCGNSYVGLFSPELWPQQARVWYDLYERHFWQETWALAGFREFPRGLRGRDWYMDVDAGPVLGGLGFAASAFGAGAARVNGRIDHAYPLCAEMLAASWPLPDGTLTIPRLLSNAADAPLLGEAAIAFILSRTPAQGVVVRTGGKLPGLTVIVVMVLAGAGAWLAAIAIRRFRRLIQPGTPPGGAAVVGAAAPLAGTSPGRGRGDAGGAAPLGARILFDCPAHPGSPHRQTQRNSQRV